MPEINAKDMSCRVRIVCSNYRAWKSSLDEAPPCTYIVKSLLLESIPSGKSPTICTSWGQLHREPAITEMWSVEVHLELDIESATNSLFPGQPTAWGSTQSTVMQSTLLNIWFCFFSPAERATETKHVLISMDSRSTTWRQLSWFLINMILLSSHSYSLSHLISFGH